ncbi:uncharacterized protein J7T54_004798 [Emericellopsis cladophorae]|uniref:Mandelate racemase/muconate lactonizing enzyme C-terminal domain-containing protein n=1 Tax=Emericellopsis cladophorae TaxID=2686198 RepID=A0A9Q0BG86_9HYPO|nr:uncharacterized protein J7T54_004798 [Emericellopsis cladophorae]KAI6784252.1 hypothetical protein J7T54_004798 [Emericellopsis cladophorae]
MRFQQSKPKEVARAVEEALRLGYRHIDAAATYDNEEEVGAGIKASGVPRSEIFLTSKLWNTHHKAEDVEEAVDESLRDLQTDYLDLYLIHWPVAFQKPETPRARAAVDTNDGGVHVIEVPVEETWRAMERMVEKGKIRTIGLSNFTQERIEEVLSFAKTKPAVLQIEAHPYFQQPALLDWCKKNDILVTAYSPSGNNVYGFPKTIDDPTVTRIAKDLGKTPAQVLIQWGVQRGTVVLPKSVTPSRIAENFVDFEIPEKAMQEIYALDRNTRYNFPARLGVNVFGEKTEEELKKGRADWIAAQKSGKSYFALVRRTKLPHAICNRSSYAMSTPAEVGAVLGPFAAFIQNYNMGKIAKIEYFRVPPRWLFVKITDDAGVVGWGEASLEGHTQAVEGCLDAWINQYTGMEADDIEHIWQKTWRMGFYRGGPVFMSALAGIDIALWDIKARKLNVPIYQLLGGKVRSTLKVYAWIGGDRPADIEQQALGRRAQGFTAVKMNGTEDVGWLDSPSTLDSCVERVKAVKALGLDAGVDFHGRVHRPMAKQLAAALAEHKPMFIEEPLLSEHIEGIKSLSALTTIPIALGERLHSRWDVKPFLEASCIDILQPDIAHVGGISELRRIAAMAEAYDVAIAPHCPLGPIALAACIQVDATLANFAIQEMSLGIHYNTGGHDLLSYSKNPEIWDVKDGFIKLMEGPGLGVDIDEDKVRELSTGAEAWVSPGFVGPGGEWREW